jgi:hypothetical protein
MSDGLTEKDKAKLKELFFLPTEGRKQMRLQALSS